MLVSAGEQSGWGTRYLRTVRLCFEMLEDTLDDRRLGDNADDAWFPAAPGTEVDIDGENVFEPSHPSHRCAGGFVGVVSLLGARDCGLRRHHEMVVPGVGSEQSVISDEMGSGTGHECGEASNKVM